MVTAVWSAVRVVLVGGAECNLTDVSDFKASTIRCSRHNTCCWAVFAGFQITATLILSFIHLRIFVLVQKDPEPVNTQNEKQYCSY